MAFIISSAMPGGGAIRAREHPRDQRNELVDIFGRTEAEPAIVEQAERIVHVAAGRLLRRPAVSAKRLNGGFEVGKLARHR